MENKEEKLSYEELEERLNNTVKQYIDLSEKFRAINNTLSRLEMLFKVIENFEHFSKEFASYTNIVSGNKQEIFTNRMEELKRTYNLSTNFEDWYSTAHTPPPTRWCLPTMSSKPTSKSECPS